MTKKKRSKALRIELNKYTVAGIVIASEQIISVNTKRIRLSDVGKALTNAITLKRSTRDT